MKKPIYKVGSVRMVIPSGRKTVDHHCGIITTTGNVCGAVPVFSFSAEATS